MAVCLDVYVSKYIANLTIFLHAAVEEQMEVAQAGLQKALTDTYRKVQSRQSAPGNHSKHQVFLLLSCHHHCLLYCQNQQSVLLLHRATGE